MTVNHEILKYALSNYYDTPADEKQDLHDLDVIAEAAADLLRKIEQVAQFRNELIIDSSGYFGPVADRLTAILDDAEVVETWQV